jgi:hypothetical protein
MSTSKLPSKSAPTQPVSGNPTSAPTGDSVSGPILVRGSDDAQDATLADIQVNDRQLRDLTRDCLDALARSNEPPHIYSRGDAAVHLVADEDGRLSIRPVTATALAGHLTRAANFYHVTQQDGKEAANPPRDAIKDMLALPVAEWNLPRLEAVCETPILRADGTVVDQAGYDPTTRRIYAPAANLKIPRIPTNPTPVELRAAIALVKQAIGEFPYVDNASKANTFAMLLTPILRSVIQGCVPVALVDAPQAGTGKSLLVEVNAIILSGSTAPMKPAPAGSDDEWRKTLTAVIHEGKGLTVFDNLDVVLNSGALALAVTCETWTDRILGRTQILTLPQSTVFIVTGNNLSLGGDIPRRCFWIRLDAQTARPWEGRKFRHPKLKLWVKTNRGRLLAALLTMARAWFAAGEPSYGTPILGSFEEWSKIVGGILAHAGIKDFLDNRDELYSQADPTEAAWAAFLRALRARFKDQPFTVKQLLCNMGLGIGSLFDNLPEELEDAHTKGNKKSFGHAFSRKIGRRFGDEGLRLERDGVTDGSARWRVRAN